MGIHISGVNAKYASVTIYLTGEPDEFTGEPSDETCVWFTDGDDAVALSGDSDKILTLLSNAHRQLCARLGEGQSPIVHTINDHHTDAGAWCRWSETTTRGAACPDGCSATTLSRTTDTSRTRDSDEDPTATEDEAASAAVGALTARARASTVGGVWDVSEAAAAVGFRVRVEMTASAWAKCVEWDPANLAQGNQSVRLRHVLKLALNAFGVPRSGTSFVVYCVPNSRTAERPMETVIDLHKHVTDDGELLVTLSAHDESWTK